MSIHEDYLKEKEKGHNIILSIEQAIRQEALTVWTVDTAYIKQKNFHDKRLFLTFDIKAELTYPFTIVNKMVEQLSKSIRPDTYAQKAIKDINEKIEMVRVKAKAEIEEILRQGCEG